MSESIAKAGTLLQVDSGSYSDYGVVGFFVVLRDFEPAKELAEFLEKEPGQKERYHFSGTQVLAAMIAKGLLLEIEHGTLHLEDYGDPKEFAFVPVNTLRTGE